MKRLKLLLIIFIVSITLVLTGCDNNYKIIFDANLGTEVESIDLTKLKDLEDLPTPNRAGYRFLGWYDETNLDKKVELVDLLDLKTNLNVVAKWETINYDILYENLEGVNPNNPLSYNFETGEIILNNPEERAGYNFLGWFYNYNSNNQVTKIESGLINSITLYAKWEIIEYQVSIYEDNETIDILKINYGQLLPKLSTPIKDGYIFLYWSLTKDGQAFDLLTPITSNISLYPVFEEVIVPVKHYVYFDLNGGVNNQPETQLVLDQGYVKRPNNPTREGYDFLGWTLDTNTNLLFKIDETKVASELILYAVWKEKPIPVEYKVSFDLNGGDGEKPADQVIISGSLVTKPKDPHLVDYDFVGWTLDKNTNEIFDFNHNIITENTVLYAVWKPEEVVAPVLPYYSNINVTSGKHFLDQLNELISVKQNITYGEVRYLLEKSDLDPNNPGWLRGMYDQKAIKPVWDFGATWDREHVWPQSKLDSKADNSTRNSASDAHNLRAINPNTNSSRSNNFFVAATDPNQVVNSKIGNKGYYPSDIDKGDVARILLFMAVRYNGTLSLTSVSSNGSTNDNQFGDLSILYEWHLADPVDQFEINRNQAIYNKQGNRNPFIDNPSWFQIVWEYLMVLDQGKADNKALIEQTINQYLTMMVTYIEERKIF